MSYHEKIIEYCTSLGLDTIGFTECRRFDELSPYLVNRKNQGIENEFEEKIIENRVNPNIYMKEGKTIISIAFPYLYDLFYKEGINFSKYTLGKDYHVVVKEYLNKICAYIESIGGKAQSFVDNNFLPERYIAHLCGIGFIGKNNMLITQKYGSYVFLGEIITDLNIASFLDERRSCKSMQTETENRCGNCEICLKSCPTSSIASHRNCNTNICLSYITQKKHIDDFWFDKFQGRLFGCDTCQRVCPYNKSAEISVIPEFTPFSFMNNIDIDELVNMDNRIFRDKYIQTSCGWRGKNIIIRNALINKLVLSKEKVNLKSIKSPYIEDYYHRLLK